MDCMYNLLVHCEDLKPNFIKNYNLNVRLEIKEHNITLNNEICSVCLTNRNEL